MRQEFTIPGRLAGLNEYVNAAHTYWKRTKLKEEQEAIVMAAADGIEPMASPVRIRITYYEGKTATRQRVRDLDNVLGGGNKFILDALTAMGVIADDDAQNVPRLTARGYMATGEPRIVVEMESED